MLFFFTFFTRIFPIVLAGDAQAINYSLDFGRMDDLPAVEAIGADLVDSSELDQYLRQYPSTSGGGAWPPAVAAETGTAAAVAAAADQEQCYYPHAARYHELQSNAAKVNFSVCQTSYQPSYQYVINNYLT